jgi:hypothetical protein
MLPEMLKRDYPSELNTTHIYEPGAKPLPLTNLNRDIEKGDDHPH